MQANPDLYQAGGALSPRVPTYVERAADRELFDALVRKQYCYVLTARQMGKSSLVVRTRQKLERADIATVLIDASAAPM